jgi:REP element-mobilizing transposase RayT
MFSTKERQPWLTPKIRGRLWAYQSRILQNLQCNSITVGGVADHVHVLCNLTKKFPSANVVEILKKDSSKFIKTLGVPHFQWQDGYGLFSVSPSHFEAIRKYVVDQEHHHKEETFQQEYLRILKNTGRRTMNDICGIESPGMPCRGGFPLHQCPEGVALGYDGSGLLA